MNETPKDPIPASKPKQQGPGPNKAQNQQARDKRLKAALKANMARRKAQAKARAADQTGTDGNENE